jgi:hypothetical protein
MVTAKPAKSRDNRHTNPDFLYIISIELVQYGWNTIIADYVQLVLSPTDLYAHSLTPIIGVSG